MIHVIDEPGTWEADVLPAVQFPDARPATRNPMLLHCGGQVIERDALFGIETPHPTETWFPTWDFVRRTSNTPKFRSSTSRPAAKASVMASSDCWMTVKTSA